MLEKPALLEFFEDMPLLQARFPRTDVGELGWLPAVDVQDTGEEVVVIAALPGVDKEDIRIEVQPDSLTLSGRRHGREGDGWARREIVSGPFSRCVALPAPVLASQASASHKDGMLEIRLPKEPQGRTLTVKIQ